RSSEPVIAPLPHRGRGWPTRSGGRVRVCATERTLTLPALRAGPLPLPRCGRGALIRHRERQERRVLLAAIDVAVVFRARALRPREADLDRQGRVVVDDDDLGR